MTKSSGSFRFLVVSVGHNQNASSWKKNKVGPSSGKSRRNRKINKRRRRKRSGRKDSEKAVKL
jgi:hypothetical protein